MRVQGEDGEAKFRRVFKFSELQDPERLLGEFGIGWADNLLSGLLRDLGMPGRAASPSLPSFKWEARNDWLKIAHSAVRVYRLQATFLDRYQAVLFVSRVGEILRIELPDAIILVNDQVANFQP